jgi:proteic killer suppression protein
MILSFGDEASSDLFHNRRTRRVRHFPNDIHSRALRKLDVLNAAHRLLDLQSPPGNRLEALSGDFNGFHSIRINRQWRIIFRWEEGNTHSVQVIDYH